jgi:uncharacterized membrane protein YphA (DoxX/SURF4 family)
VHGASADASEAKMPAFITIGRFLFAVFFIVSGASMLLDLAATAQVITEKVALPVALATYTSQLEELTGMPMAQMLAIAAGTLELVGGLLIAVNFGARFFAVVLIFAVAAGTFYFYDFWNQAGPEASNNMVHALKNLSLIGGLFMIAGFGRSLPAAVPVYTEPASNTY